MSDLALKIRADFDDAQKAFQKLSDESAEAGMKLRQFTKEFADKKADEFIAKQKLAGAAIMSTRGDLAALQSQQSSYQREIERLIKDGLNPQSEAVQKLQKELGNTNTQLEQHAAAQKRAAELTQLAAQKLKDYEQAVKVAEQGLKLLGGAALAAGATILAMTQKTAEAGDEYAKTARKIGMTAETYQELEYAAKQSGLSGDALSGSLQKLNKTVGDVKSGTGALATYLKANNPALLEQVKNVKSNEEAFNLLMGAIKNTPNEFERAALAQAAFGKSGQDLIVMAEAGADGIAALREEARKFGVISNDTADYSEKFINAQTRLKSAFEGVRNELSENMIPRITDVINKAAEFISKIDDWDGIFRKSAAAVTVAASVLGTFVAVSKAHAIVSSMATAVRALMLAATGPAGLAALAVGGVVTGLILLVNHARDSADAYNKLHKEIKQTDQASRDLLSSYSGGNEEKVIDEELTKELIRLYPELTGVISANTTTVREAEAAQQAANTQRVIEAEAAHIKMLQEKQAELRRAMKDLEMLEDAQRRVTADYESMTERERQAQAERYQLQHDAREREIAGNKQTTKEIIAEIQRREREINRILVNVGRRYLLSGDIIEIDIPVEITPPTPENITKINDNIGDVVKTLQQRLSEISKSFNQIQNEQINTVRSYLSQRADLERVDGEERIAFLEQQREALKNNATLTADERIAAEKAVNEEITKIQDDLAKKDEDRRQSSFQKLVTDLAARKDLITQAFENIGKTTEQLEVARQQRFTQFLDESLAAEDAYRATSAENDTLAGEERIAWMQAQRDLILEQFGQYSEEYFSAQAALNARIEAEEKRQAEIRLQIFTDTSEGILNAISGFAEASLNVQQEYLTDRLRAFDESAAAELNNENLTAEQKMGIEERLDAERKRIIDEANSRAHRAAVSQRVVANAEATIQTFLAANKAFASGGGFPYGLIPMAATIAAGLANVAKINTTPIPSLSAETGASFIAPNTGRVDSHLVRVNDNERIDITPAGRSGSDNSFHFVFNVDNKTIWDIVNRGARAGEIYTLAPAGNL